MGAAGGKVWTYSSIGKLVQRRLVDLLNLFTGPVGAWCGGGSGFTQSSWDTAGNGGGTGGGGLHGAIVAAEEDPGEGTERHCVMLCVCVCLCVVCGVCVDGYVGYGVVER